MARHSAEYALLALARSAFRGLQPERAIAAGAAVGRAYARGGLPRTADAAHNIALAFPELTRGDREALAIASFESMGRCIAEVFLMQGPHRDEMLAGLTVDGLANYEAARASSPSGGVICLTAHFGSWELCGAAMAQIGHPLSVVHHPIPNPHIEEMVRAWRRAAEVEEIAMGRAAMGVFRALSRGRIVTMLLDQNASRDEGVFAPFFGHEASTRSGPALIAMSREVPVVPVFVFRTGNTTKHVVRVFPALEIEPIPETDAETPRILRENVGRMNEAIERAIRIAPDHWLWPHRRFKTRPPGEPPLYPPRRSRRRGSRPAAAGPQDSETRGRSG